MENTEQRLKRQKQKTKQKKQWKLIKNTKKQNATPDQKEKAKDDPAELGSNTIVFGVNVSTAK